MAYSSITNHYIVHILQQWIVDKVGINVEEHRQIHLLARVQNLLIKAEALNLWIEKEN
jgi:hypothetical protein